MVTSDGDGVLSVEQEIEPLSLSLLGRLFGVPLIIISVIVGGAVLVVVLFGGTSMPERRSVEALMQALEANSGERSLGVLLPREKELWQTALELCDRLTNQPNEFTPAELADLSARLGALVSSDLSTLERLPTSGRERTDQLSIRSRRLEFVIHALGKTKQPSAVAGLVEVVRTAPEPYAIVAMRELGDLNALADARAAAPAIVELLGRARQRETKLVSCTALSVLAPSGDLAVIDALERARVGNDGDVSWAASLALARLGNLAGKPTLLDLMDRAFWEQADRYEVVDAAGKVRRYRMPPDRVNAYLIAAMEAAAALSDADIQAAIVALAKDQVLSVRSRAEELLAARNLGT